MGENNNRKSETITEKEKIKEINKELSKFSLTYNELPERTQKYILRAEEFFIDQNDKMIEVFNEVKKVDFTVDAFCQYAGIARSTIYKKNSNGLKSYKPVIDYINSKGVSCEQQRLTLMRQYLRTGTTDQELMNSLLEKEIERMNIKQELQIKNEQIKTLEEQLKAYKKLLKNSNLMS